MNPLTAFPKTHNLVELLELCLQRDASFEPQRRELILLDRYAVRYGYPGDTATRHEATQAVSAAQAIRAFARGKLGI